MLKILETFPRIRNDNGAGSGRVAPIPTPPYLLKTIPIPVPFKTLNGAERVWEISYTRPAPPYLVFFLMIFLKKLLLKFLITLK